MITEYHFPTLVYIKDIPNAAQLNQYLEPKIIQWSQQDKRVSKTNAGGWQDEENWEEVHSNLIEYIIKFEKSFVPYIKKLNMKYK